MTVPPTIVVEFTPDELAEVMFAVRQMRNRRTRQARASGNGVGTINRIKAWVLSTAHSRMNAALDSYRQRSPSMRGVDP